jgi:hypothetical protein
MFTLRNVIITITSIAVLGIGINAFAHGGRSWGQHRGNMHYQGDYGKGNMNQMSPEEYKQFDQKRIENMLEMRKLNPNAGAGRGFKSDGPRKGSGGPMMGYGYNRGGGYCW